MELHEVEAEKSKKEVFRRSPVAARVMFFLGGGALSFWLAFHWIANGSVDLGIYMVIPALVGVYGLVTSIVDRLRGRLEVYPDRIVIVSAFGAPVSIHNDHLYMLQQWIRESDARSYFKLVVEGGKSYDVTYYERRYRLHPLLLERIGETQLEMQPKIIPSRKSASQL